MSKKLPEGWKSVKLGSLFEIKKGKKVVQIDEKTENSVRCIQIEDLRDNLNIKYCEYNEKYIMANCNDILIAWDGANAGTVGYGIEGAVGSTLAILRCNQVVCTKYIAKYLQSKFDYLRSTCTGATIPHINRQALESLNIPLPSLEEQERIVSILEKAENTIEKREEIIKLLDELVKSRFIEMFGDPAFNPMKWDVVELNSLLREKASNGFFAKNDEYKTEGNAKVMWLGDVINTRYSNTEELRQVDVTDAQLNKYRVKYGDLLFCRSSLTKEGIGKSSAVPKNVDDNIMFECHVIRTPLDLSKCVPEFIQIQSTMDYFRNQIMSNSKTSTMTTIGQEGIITTKVTLPDLELQTQFVEVVEQVDKLKFEMEKSLKELENNFNSLMQKVFNGEL